MALRSADDQLPGARSTVAAFAAIFAALWLVHAPWLRLPYFWDEAGYFIPAARDILLYHDLIPRTTLSNAHPPLVMILLAAAWKLTTYSPLVTRTAMLAVASAGLTALWRIARRVASPEVAVAAVALSALSPTIFSQSMMAQLDIGAFALVLWMLERYLSGKLAQAIVLGALAAVTKETTVAITLTLFGLDLLGWLGRRWHPALTERWILTRRTLVQCAAWLLALVPLIGWYAYHHHRTGHVFGNPDYLRYNVGATVTPTRIFFAFLMRVWHAMGYMNLFVLTVPALLLWWSARGKHRDEASPQAIPPAVCLLFLLVIAAQVTEFSVVGGALLARYMIPAIPLAVLLAVNLLQRELPQWKPWLVACALAFAAALFFNPPWFISPEDNLCWTSYVSMHQQASRYVAQHYGDQRILTAWTSSDELNRPFLGYVAEPLTVVRLENFSGEEILRATQSPQDFDVVVAFSTKYEPPRGALLARIPGFTHLQTRYFDFHQDLKAAVIARELHGRVVYERHTVGEWIAVIEIDKIRNARLELPLLSGHR